MDDNKVPVTFEAVTRFVQTLCNTSIRMSKAAGFDMGLAANYATHASVCILQTMQVPNTPEVQRMLAEVLTLQIELHYGQKIKMLHDGQKPV